MSGYRQSAGRGSLIPVMSRRGFLALPLVAGGAPAPVSALVLGDSLAFQFGPRLAKVLRRRGHRMALDAQGGSSARQWLRTGRFRKAVEAHPTRALLVFLGVNCLRSERPRLAADIGALAALARSPVCWLLPSREGYRFSIDYLYAAVEEAGVSRFASPPLPLESDRVHLTSGSNERLAVLVADRFWPAA